MKEIIPDLSGSICVHCKILTQLIFFLSMFRQHYLVNAFCNHDSPHIPRKLVFASSGKLRVKSECSPKV